MFLGGSLWFGGSRKLSTGFSPLIGYLDPATLAVQQAHYWDVTATNSADEYTMIEKMYSSQSSSNNLIIGLGNIFNSDYSRKDNTKFFMVIGRDQIAAQDWTNVGCGAWSFYYLTSLTTARYMKFDDIQGPMTEGGDEVLYIYARTWQN